MAVGCMVENASEILLIVATIGSGQSMFPGNGSGELLIEMC